MNFTNIKKIPFEIAVLLSNNLCIQELLLNDSENINYNHRAEFADLNADAQKILKERYIEVGKPVEYGIEKNDKNTFINIMLDSVTDDEDESLAHGEISLVTNGDHVLLSENRDRLLELTENIWNSLDNQKLSTAGIVSISSANMNYYSPDVYGYIIDFYVSDQNNSLSRKAEI